jgi:hypothetical protein
VENNLKKNKVMKKLCGLSVMLLFGILLLFRCGPNYTTYHTDKIYLRQLVNKDVTKNYTSGSFFFIAGSASSESETSTVVKLMGNVNGEYRFMQFDFEKIRIKIDNNVKTPYIVLNYRNDKPNGIDYLLEYSYNIKTVTIVCPEQYLPEKLLPIQI